MRQMGGGLNSTPGPTSRMHVSSHGTVHALSIVSFSHLRNSVPGQNIGEFVSLERETTFAASRGSLVYREPRTPTSVILEHRSLQFVCTCFIHVIILVQN